MNSHINLSHPENIYDDLKEKISELIAKIGTNENSLDTHLVGEQFSESKQILDFQQKEIERKMDELKGNTEWDFFTIAFFGETNAGKSTLIEVLRLLFAENTKKEMQTKFIELQNEFLLHENEYEQLKQVEHEASIKYLEDKQILSDIDHTYTQKLSDYQLVLNNMKSENDQKVAEQIYENERKLEPLNVQIDALKENIKNKKQRMSWWLKIIYIFKRLEEEKQIGLLKLEIIEQKRQLADELSIVKQQLDKDFISKKSFLVNIQEEYDVKRSDQNLIIEKLQQEIKTIEAQLHQFEKMLEKLRVYEDGQIMGDGRSDYTQLSNEFLFNINGTQVKLIDVPGIEGNEILVENEISKAVKRAHAVFYVTSKDAAPNEGTLTKIKTHLADQTEVWTIYNKPVTSPRSLKKGLISNDDETTALNDLNELMKNALGKNYKDYTVVAGLAAFYAVANCLVPYDEKYRNQVKFLNNSDREELKAKSGIDSFQNHLTQQVIGNVPYKIKASNFNKANYVLMQTVEKLKKVNSGFIDLKSNIDKQLAVTKQEVDSDYLELVQNLKLMIEKVIQKFEQETRQNVYERIDSDISNDDFKIILKNEIDKNIALITEKLQEGFTNETNIFDENIKQKLQKLSTRLVSIQNNFKSDDVTDLKGSINLKFDINSGINKMGLFGVGIGVAAAAWWNPVGWVAISLTAVGLIFSFAKAVFSFFSKDFKKSEQRKSVDKNLSNIVRELKRVARENLSNVEERIEPSLIDLKIKLKEPSDQIESLVQDINQSIKIFNVLSENINSSYGVK